LIPFVKSGSLIFDSPSATRVGTNKRKQSQWSLLMPGGMQERLPPLKFVARSNSEACLAQAIQGWIGSACSGAGENRARARQGVRSPSDNPVTDPDTGNVRAIDSLRRERQPHRSALLEKKNVLGLSHAWGSLRGTRSTVPVVRGRSLRNGPETTSRFHTDWGTAR